MFIYSWLTPLNHIDPLSFIGKQTEAEQSEMEEIQSYLKPCRLANEEASKVMIWDKSSMKMKISLAWYFY